MKVSYYFIIKLLENMGMCDTYDNVYIPVLLFE